MHPPARACADRGFANLLTFVALLYICTVVYPVVTTGCNCRMDLAVETPARCTVYRRRRPEHTPLYRAVQGHLETYLALAREGHNDGDGVPQYVEGEFRRYLECGILAHGSGVID